MRNIEIKEELIDYLTRVCAAYRKIYKLYGRLIKALQITGGILGSTAVLAIVPVISVFVAAISVVPIVIGIITIATQLNDKNYVKLYDQSEDNLTEQLIKDVF